MIYTCLIVDDEELARELIETHLSQLDNFKIIASCENALEAQKQLQTQAIDLLFLDIEMPVLKGTDFLKSLPQQPKVIFTTAYRDYAIEGFELNAIDYLLKPIEFERFFKAIQKFLDSQPRQQAQSRESHIFIQSNKKNIKVQLEEVLYIESLKDYVKIHFQDNFLVFKSGLTAFESKLDDRFLRVHRSFIVNMDKITAFTKHDIEIVHLEIPIGEHYKAMVLKKLR